MLKINNESTRNHCKISSKLRDVVVMSIVNCPTLTFTLFTTFSSVSIVGFEQINVCSATVAQSKKSTIKVHLIKDSSPWTQDVN